MEQTDPRLVAAFVVAGTFEILLPVGLALYVRKKLGVSWKVIGLGALAFAASQLLTRLPLATLASIQLRPVLAQSLAAQMAWLGFLAVTAGLFEETARYLCFRYRLKERSNWPNAVALGVGHGGLESALLVGVGSIATAIGVVVLGRLDPATLPGATPESTAALEQAKTTFAALRWWEPLLGAWERITSIAVHVSLSVMVLQRFVRGTSRWYWAAVAYHTVTNIVAVATLKYRGPVAAEIVLTGFLLASLVFVFRMRPRERPKPETPV